MQGKSRDVAASGASRRVAGAVLAVATSALVGGAIAMPAAVAAPPPSSAAVIAPGPPVSPCPVPAGSSVKVRILAPDTGTVLDLASTPSLDVQGLVKGKGSDALTGVELYLDDVDAGTAPVVATTPATRAKGADGRWDRGVPLTAGSHTLTACARTATGPVAVDSIQVATAAITTSMLPAGVVKQAYSAQLATTVPNAVWAATGALPAGLVLSRDGLLSGTPTTAGVTPLNLTVVDRKQIQLSAHAVLSLSVTLTAKPTGVVCAWGSNAFGQLGAGAGPDATGIATPVPAGIGAVTALAAARQTAYALKSDGTVWGWGNGADGALGTAVSDQASAPVRINGLSDVTAIAAADATGYALRSDGTVWAWGLGGYAGLGNGTYEQSSSAPVQVTGLSGVTAIAGAGLTAFAVKSDGTVWGWGEGDDGQLGDQPGFNGHYSTAVAVQIPGLKGISAVAGNQEDEYALAHDGTVWAWGSGASGALGNGTSADAPHPVPVQVAAVTGATAIAADQDDGYALLGDGTVWAWGAGGDGALGDGATADRRTPVKVAGLSGVTALADVLGATEYAVKADGTLWAWGLGDGGVLGNGTGLNDYHDVNGTPVQVSGLNTAFAAAGADATGYAVVATGADPDTACLGPAPAPVPAG